MAVTSLDAPLDRAESGDRGRRVGVERGSVMLVDELDLAVREVVRREGVDPQRESVRVRAIAESVVREVVRREGVDPQRESVRVRAIAESVVREHDERSLTGMVASVPDVGAMVGELVARVSGFGPLQPFLDDPSVEEIWTNDPVSIR